MKAHFGRHKRVAFQNGQDSHAGEEKLLSPAGPSNTLLEGRQALTLYEKMMENGGRSDLPILLAALKACGSLRNIHVGTKIHAAIIGSRQDLNINVANTLIHMYLKCRNRLDACCIFDRISHQTVVSWNAVIFGFTEIGECESALKLFATMQGAGIKPSALSFIGAMKSCAACATKEVGKVVQGKLLKRACLQKGIAIHLQLANSGFEPNISVTNTLIDMYAKCGSMPHAAQVFNEMQHHNVVSWNAMIFGYIESGESDLALHLFSRMQYEGFKPSNRTYLAALKACAGCAVKEEGKHVQGKLLKVACLEKGITLYSQLAKGGHEGDIFVVRSLMDMYAKCRSMVHVFQVFDRMAHLDVVLWNDLIFGYEESGESKLAMDLFVRMQDDGLTPDGRTYVGVLKACASCAEEEESKQVKIKFLEKAIAIHSQLAKNGHELDIFVANMLIDTYAKCGRLACACRVFEKMKHHDVVSWSAVIFGYAETGEVKLALQLFAHMQDEGFIPNSRTYVAALKACASLASKEEATQVKGKLMKVKCIEKGIAIHSQLTMGDHQLDIFVASMLVDMYAKCRSMIHAQHVFDRMLYHDVVSWNAMIFGYADSGECELALHLFAQIQGEGFTPDARTYVAALKACGDLGALKLGKELHDQICLAGFQEDSVLTNCLVGFYGKCGSMAEAEQVFGSMNRRDLVTWNALLAGYAHQGDARRVFDLFETMERESVQADGITFLCILTVCSHAGLVEKGKEYFEVMCLRYMIVPSIEHYACMVDLLGRANRLDDALAFVKIMPCQPNLTIWKTLLSACQKWKNVVVAKLAFESILQLDKEDTPAYVLMASIYMECGMQEETAKIEAMRGMLAFDRSQKEAVDNVGGVVDLLYVRDTSHSETEEIQSKFQLLVN